MLNSFFYLKRTQVSQGWYPWYPNGTAGITTSKSENIRRVGEILRVGENMGGWDNLVSGRGLILTGGWDFSRERVRSRAVKPAPVYNVLEV